MGEVRLLGAWPSPFVVRVRVALNVKGVAYEFMEETMSPKSKLLLKSNPVHKKIPVLLHEDRPVCESLVIVQYVDEAWASGSPILPANPYDRAMHRFWAAYVDDKWFPSLFGILAAQTEEAEAEAVERVFAGLELLEEAFAKLSKGKAFFGGDDIGFLDIALGCHLAGLKATAKMTGITFLDVAKTPLIIRWAERFCAHDTVKGVMPDTGKMMEFVEVMQARWKAAPPTK